jgi:hypothetical protein
MITMGYCGRLCRLRRRFCDHVLMTTVMITGWHLMSYPKMIMLAGVRGRFRYNAAIYPPGSYRARRCRLARARHPAASLAHSRRGQPRLASRSAHACSHRRHVSAQMRQCSCMPAWPSHSAAQLAQAVRHACRTTLVRLAS